MSTPREMRKQAKQKAQEAIEAKEAGDFTQAEILLAEAKQIGMQADELAAQQKREEKTRMPDQPCENIDLSLEGQAEKEAPPNVGVITLAQQEYDTLVSRMRQLELANKQAKVKEITGACLARGVPPVVVKLAERVLMACEIEAEPTIRLSEDSPHPVNLFGAVTALIESVPGRIGEHAYGLSEQKPPMTLSEPKKPVTVEEAERIAKERRIQLGLTKTAGDPIEIEL